ncbi:MAG: pyrroline-5-carboxylate reductase [Alphaproteobacteria bacterium]|nr:pyrroline-5-carboxylate reductase [Alphaproteobacteria bacterium]
MRLSLALVGCGAMGSALLKGWLTLANSEQSFKNFWIVTPHRKSVEPFLEDSRVYWFPSPEGLPQPPEVIFFAVKPFLLEDILSSYKAFDSLMVSVVTGKSIAFYEKRLSPSHLIIRAMPNLPVGVHKGVIGLFTPACLSTKHKTFISTCLQNLGFCTWLKSEDEIDKITALSGSGPAYVYYFMEAFARSAESLGFTKEIAVQLALHTFWGASSYARDLDESPETTRQRVTSSKGTTAAALKILETGHLDHLIDTAVKAAYTRAKEIGHEKESL